MSPVTMRATPELLVSGPDWDFDRLRRVHDAIEAIAVGQFGLDVYANQIEVITAEQMLDAYSSIGMPLMYKHWSFGKQFAQNEVMYRKGYRGLAYEIVINSSPCISYVMEENSMAMQTLVIAHAAFGHNHFFKNNQLFRQWTDAEAILGYLDFAKSYVARCEERYGHKAVERLLDAAHALMNHGVHRYKRKRLLDLRQEEKRERERQQYQESMVNDIWRTVPGAPDAPLQPDEAARRKARLRLPEENLLYFLEKVAPRLQPWQREILRIVRHLAQYFYPQQQTKVMNEGCATFVHYKVVEQLYDRGQLSEGAMLEILDSHTAVVRQLDFDHPHYNGINPYWLGFGMMSDIMRIASEPTDEDREWFPAIAGNGDPWGTLRSVWRDYRDESFVLQFLSPHLMRKMKLFRLHDDAAESELVVNAIHDERGYREVREALARSYDVGLQDPDIQVVDVDLAGDRRLVLHHRQRDGISLEADDARRVLRHIANLWGYPVRLVEVDAGNDRVTREYEDTEPRDPFM